MVRHMKDDTGLRVVVILLPCQRTSIESMPSGAARNFDSLWHEPSISVAFMAHEASIFKRNVPCPWLARGGNKQRFPARGAFFPYSLHSAAGLKHRVQLLYSVG